MNLNYTRKYYRFLHKTDGIFLHNPILSLGLALPLAVIPSYGLAGTMAISFSMLICFVPIVLIASVIGDSLPRYMRVITYPVLSYLLLFPAKFVVQKISPVIFDTLGVYFSLICVNTLLIYTVEKVQLKKPTAALAFAFRQWIGASLVTFLCGFLRKLLATGSMWNLSLFKSIPALSVAQMAFGGLIFLGFLAAFFRLIHRLILKLTLNAGNNAPNSEPKTRRESK